MSQLIHQVKSFLAFYREAKTIYQAHSPTLYQFAKTVLHGDGNPIFREIEKRRQALKKDDTEIHFVELGAGSNADPLAVRTVASIAKTSLSRPRQCEQIARMLALYRPTHVIEMGTSLGISTLYMSAGHSGAKINTLEGDPTVAAKAEESFDMMSFADPKVISGPFDYALQPLLDELEFVDLVFIDGNHRYAPTMSYFESILGHSRPSTILIFDDIYWSKEMQQAWTDIKNHPSVTMTIDLYHMGVVYLDKGLLPKQHHKLIEYRYKPWRIGIFG